MATGTEDVSSFANRRRITTSATRASSLPASVRTWVARSSWLAATAGNNAAKSGGGIELAALFPAVAASQDDLATQVLTDAGRELARVAEVVMRRLFAKDETSSVPVAMAGGVFRHAPRVREVFYNELRALDPRAEIHPNIVEPVEGALRMARRAAKEGAQT